MTIEIGLTWIKTVGLHQELRGLKQRAGTLALLWKTGELMIGLVKTLKGLTLELSRSYYLLLVSAFLVLQYNLIFPRNSVVVTLLSLTFLSIYAQVSP